jgi:hypothetical protein
VNRRRSIHPAPKRSPGYSPPWQPSNPTSTRSWRLPYRRERDEVSSGRSAGATSISSRDRLGFFAPCSMPKAVRCCVRRRLAGPIGSPGRQQPRAARRSPRASEAARREFRGRVPPLKLRVLQRP